MKHIVLFGAGKSATVLISYLKELATEKQWRVTVADSQLVVAAAKTGIHPLVQPVQTDILDDSKRKELIGAATLVISMLPPALHYLVALDCLAYKKTPAYGILCG